MNKAAIDILYNWAKNDGFSGSVDGFVELLHSNSQFTKKAYEAAKNTGYNGDEASFMSMIGISPVSTDGKYTSSLSNGLMPVGNGVTIRDIGGDDGKLTVKPAYQENADKIILDIYNSVGYKRKINNEIKQSSGTSDTRDTGYYYGGTYDANDLIEERKGRVLGTVVREVMEEEGGDLGGSLSVRFRNKKSNQHSNKEEFDAIERDYYSVDQPLDTEIEIYPKNIKSKPIKSNDNQDESFNSDIMALTIEEKEHAAHVPKNNPKGLREKASNVTQYAANIVADNTVIDDDYLREPTEVIAKKRAAEVYLIGKGKLEPGGDAGEDHFKELLNEGGVPFNIRQLLQAVSGVQDIDNVQSIIKSDPKLYKESLDRFLNIINKIAYQDNEPKGNRDSIRVG